MPLRSENIPKGPSVNHIGSFFGHFWLSHPPLYTVLLNKSYVIIWSFVYPPSMFPWAWFMDDPLRYLAVECNFAKSYRHHQWMNSYRILSNSCHACTFYLASFVYLQNWLDFSLVATRVKHRFFFVKRYIQFCDLYENERVTDSGIYGDME